MRALTLAVLGASLLAACTSTTPPATQVGAATPSSLASATSSAASPSPSSSGASEGPDFFTGVVDTRPAGWSFQTDFSGLSGFPNTFGLAYGPDGVSLPPYEGPGRLALYETFSTNRAYLESRVEQSRNRGGRAVAVQVNGDPAEVWLDETTGELVLGWIVREKSEVLVANSADFTVAELVRSAESVSDCCG